jgi:hypothetical protein
LVNQVKKKRKNVSLMPTFEFILFGFIVVKFISYSKQKIPRNNSGVIICNYIAVYLSLQIKILIQ